jgi:protein-tyrosine phosphatase
MTEEVAGAGAGVGTLILPHAPNFRELGGIGTNDGRRLARGRVYRSEALTTLGDDEWASVSDLGLRLVCDLRSPKERAKHPIQWVGDRPRFAEIAILPDVRTAGPEIMQSIVSDASGGAARRLLLENYAAMPRAFEHHLPDLVGSIVDERELPLLIACTAGKDRTGFVCALLLSALGVSYDDIVADYLRSNEWFDPTVIRDALAAWLGAESEVTPSDAVLDALKVHIAYLDSAFAAIERDYGSLDTYLTQAGGLDERRRSALRAALLEEEPLIVS